MVTNESAEQKAQGELEQKLTQLDLALSLSGGGTRAMLFHLGVLRFLAEINLFERVRYLSTVSGGTLLMGCIFHYNGMHWPSSSQFVNTVAPAIRQALSKTDLQWSAIKRLLLLWNWRYIAFRANVLGEAIWADWGISSYLKDLPPSPVWAINTTTMESGRRWRFRATPEGGAVGRQSMGDGKLGYSYDQDFPLASAMATSAAFPGGISPLVLKTERRSWFLPDFADRSQPEKPITPLFKSYHLADGGIYDNLGLEPLFDVGKQIIRPETKCNYIIISDAGAPLREQRWGFFSQFIGFSMRTIDIMGSQQRNLRVRTLVSAFTKRTAQGVFVNIAEPGRVAIDRARAKRADAVKKLGEQGWLSVEDSLSCAAYKTTLRSPPKTMMELIERHGYETAKIQLQLWG